MVLPSERHRVRFRQADATLQAGPGRYVPRLGVVARTVRDRRGERRVPLTVGIEPTLRSSYDTQRRVPVAVGRILLVTVVDSGISVWLAGVLPGRLARADVGPAARVRAAQEVRPPVGKIMPERVSLDLDRLPRPLLIVDPVAYRE